VFLAAYIQIDDGEFPRSGRKLCRKLPMTVCVCVGERWRVILFNFLSNLPIEPFNGDFFIAKKGE
jgi:hypothetical protein